MKGILLCDSISWGLVPKLSVFRIAGSIPGAVVLPPAPATWSFEGVTLGWDRQPSILACIWARCCCMPLLGLQVEYTLKLETDVGICVLAFGVLCGLLRYDLSC